MQTKIKCLCLLLIVCLAAGLLPGIALGQEGHEARWSVDGGQTWTEGRLLHAITSCYEASASDVRIELLRDVVLTWTNWKDGKVLANAKCTLTIDGKNHTLKRGEGISIVGVVNMPDSEVILKNIIVDGGAVWEGNDPATRRNTGLSFDEYAPLFSVYADRTDPTQGGKLILESGAVLQNSHLTGNQYGAAVSVGRENGGRLVIRNGAQIRNNAAHGGAVFVRKGGYVWIEGGKLSGNYAANNGGAVYVENGTLQMNGGEISGNKAKAGGGGVFIKHKDTKFVLEGGKIIGNAIEGQTGGGVLVQEGKMSVSLIPVVRDNTGGDGKPNNVYLPSGKVLSVYPLPLFGEASIGVTTEVVPTDEAPVTIAETAYDVAMYPYFRSDGGYGFITENIRSLKLGDHVHVYEENAWKWDETTHWQVCAACDEETEPVPHNMTDEKCTVCGYVKPVPPPDIPLTGDESLLMLWAGLLLLSGAGIVGLIICKRKGLFKR